MSDDAAKYAAMKAEMDREDGIEPQPQQHYQGGEQYQPEPPQHQYQPQPDPLPDVMDDPIGHFTKRAQQLETFAVNQAHEAQRQNFYNHVVESEKQWRGEVPDYDTAADYLLEHRQQQLAQQLPDTREGYVFARQHGFETPAHMRAALIERDKVDVAQTAVQHGMSPAEYYYSLAVERGYQPKVAMTNTQRKNLSRAIEKASDTGDYSSFDKLWDQYARISKVEEERSRRR